MREFNRLLDFRSYFEYDFEYEIVRVKEGPQHDEVYNFYTSLVKGYFMTENIKWAFDIALDCIRNFEIDECETIQRQGKIFDYHFVYGMYVRNTYVHPSKLHNYLMANEISGRVAGFIYTILLPVYNCLSDNFMELECNYDFQDIKEQYGNSHPIIEHMRERLADFKNETTAEEALTIIVETIRSELGKDGFKNTILPIIEDHVSKHRLINIEWKNLADKLYSKTKIYHKEFNQFRALREMGFLNLIAKPYPSIHSIEEACEYIKANLGLSDDDALLMAECAFEAVKIQDDAN